jgi:hypothetical protein
MRRTQEKKKYERPRIKTEKGAKELSLNCPTTNVYHCGASYSPKKGS